MLIPQDGKKYEKSSNELLEGIIMNIMTKRGTRDNIITYEHICDAMEDLPNIDPT